MYKVNKQFGYEVFGKSLGESWIDLVEVVLKFGKKSFDEKRERKALLNVRIKSATQNLPDKIINKYAHTENLKAMLDLTFSEEVMRDIDVVKSFRIGAKSYHKRIKEGRLLNFVIERLAKIPESKKAVIVFPTYDDYKAILENHGDDYLPCIVSVQFRLIPAKNGFILNTNFYARSMDVFQKGHGNLVAIAMFSEIVARGIGQKLNQKIKPGFIDGIIADGHIYKETFNEARKTLEKYKND